MAYKYKESIKDAVNEVYSASFADELNRKNELDEVYRKAEAFDAILKSYDEALSEGHMADEVSNIIEKYESGESKVYKCTCGARYWSMDNYKEHLTNCFYG